MQKNKLVWIWLLLLLGLIYIYFFHPEVYQHIFQYPGPGSPYVNTPAG